jgi:hypothetical protein
MTRKRTALAALVSLVLTASIVFGDASTAGADDGDSGNRITGTWTATITHWNQIAASTLAAFPQSAGGAAPTSQINLAMVQGAVYDAVNAITPKHHRSYLLKRRFSASASGEAAVATAATRVLSHIIETVPAGISFPNKGTLLQTVADAHTASLAAIPDNSFKREGIDAGNAAADAMIAAREDDGRFGPSQWVPSSNVGHWDPVAPNGTIVQDPTPWVGGVEPFLMESSSQFRSPGPLALTSSAYTAEFNEVKTLGAINSAARSEMQTYIAKWWQSNPVVSWNAVARDLVARNDLDAAESARLFAMTNLSGADAAINCWNDKYHFDFWRPFQAIRRAGEPAEGNPDTSPDPTWTPLLSAAYPDHTSGHLCHDGAHVTVLQMFFGNVIAGGFQITSAFVNPGGPATRTFSTFSQALDEIVEARIWAGLHFRTADVQGRDLGIGVANFMADNYFQPVGNG